ncbi:uncharacterized protein LOC129775048 [Toxorhynchites rutilus septentrionalis]|uniref:uncharacterized protein LOC129775048 n=1 Tax=Toxorhynchites rutilus septentrionalis TaxID=329112 RepID=UPI00247A4C3E|nr:uncharacterized protein LOC129775048 [Toxorhynchites rutilus septentrionalis]
MRGENILIIFIGLFIRTVIGSVRFTNLSYELSSDYVKGTVNVKMDNGVYSVGMNSDLLKKIDGNFWVTPILSKKIKDAYIPLTDIKLDTCKEDPSSAENPVVRFISAEVKKLVTFGLKCPYEPGHYTVNDFSFEDGHSMLKLIPKGSYHVSITCQHQPPGSSSLIKVMSFSFYADID